jgi:hypothetical protein
MAISELFNGKTPGRHVTSEGAEEWYDDHERLHRADDLPAVTDTFGGKAWFRHGKLHRENDQPAIEAANGDRAWYENDVLHRERGPAVVYADKSKAPEYWLHGHKMTDDERIARDAAFAAAAAKKNGETVKSEMTHGTGQPVTPLKRIHLKR